MRTIVRYNNRKMYDAVQRRFVTAAEIMQMLKDGIEFDVAHYSTNISCLSAIMARHIAKQMVQNDISVAKIKEISNLI